MWWCIRHLIMEMTKLITLEGHLTSELTFLQLFLICAHLLRSNRNLSPLGQTIQRCIWMVKSLSMIIVYSMCLSFQFLSRCLWKSSWWWAQMMTKTQWCQWLILIIALTFHQWKDRCLFQTLVILVNLQSSNLILTKETRKAIAALLERHRVLIQTKSVIQMGVAQDQVEKRAWRKVLWILATIEHLLRNLRME